MWYPKHRIRKVFEVVNFVLASSGKLAELQEKWLNKAQNVPTLK